MSRLTMRYQRPTGVRTVRDVCGVYGPIEIPAYPPSPQGQALRNARVAAGLSLRELARRMGLRAQRLSDIERGAAAPDDWEACWEASGLRPDQAKNKEVRRDA